MKSKIWLTIFFVLILLFGLGACSNDESKSKDNNQAVDHSQMNHGEKDSNQANQQGTNNTFIEAPTQFNEAANKNLVTMNTKNVTRLNTNNPIEAAVYVSQTIFPATEKENQPGTVILVQVDDWQAGLASADLIHHPNNGPILFMNRDGIPEATINEIRRLNPLGNSEGTQVMVMGDVPSSILTALQSYKVENIKGANAIELASQVDDKYARVSGGEYPNSVIIVSAQEEAKLFSLAAVNWIAHMPEPILYVTKDEVPEATLQSLNKRENPNLYILGNEEVISKDIEKKLSAIGKVTRITGDDAVQTAVGFAKFKDDKTGFGWGLIEPGHGVSFISTATPELAIAAAPFSHLGKHAPLIWLDNGSVSEPVYSFLASIKPTFKDDPTAGPYNHGFVIGTEEEISYRTQGIMDNKLEIVQEDGQGHGGH
ncbi:cell wall-binding repeat-containing protein [Bacillus massiliigorillae]|uniref:cell wall-binding repeat-containing protein n=1 Tax=Bacillus massiliigorillae TaxID=1243664 RepID=UPI0003A4685C|nr:cell wall-binding repeat-containing protein [Bacillus massiliigorillae]